MKGLIQKDLYALWADLRAFLVLDAILILAARFSESTGFMMFYPCILSGLVTMSLISYEEKEKWEIFAETLPYSRAQRVSAKYVLALLVIGLTLIATALVQLTRPNGQATLPEILLTMVPMSLLPTSLLLPFIYKLGAEKGRIWYYIVLGSFADNKFRFPS